MSYDPKAHYSDEFRSEVEALPADIDELGHVSNLVYLRWVQDVAVAHSVAVGWDHAAYVRAGGVFVVRRHEIEYVVPAFVGDRVTLVTWVESMAAASSPRSTRIVRTKDGVELARATTLWVWVSSQGGRPRRIPKDVQEAFRRLPPAGDGPGGPLS